MHFVLDQNFPVQATGLPWPAPISLSRLRDIDPALTRDHEDWQIFRALRDRGDVDGFITNDANLLDLPREMVMLSLTKLTLVVTKDMARDPLGATGLLMLHLPQIARQNHPTPRIYVLSRPRLHLTKVRPVIEGLAVGVGIPIKQLLDEEIGAIRRTPS